MALRNIENEFKAQLQNREIEPSAESWDALSSQLDANKADKKMIQYWWVRIAAAVAVGIFIGSMIFNNPVKTETEIVETPVQINSEETRLVESEAEKTETVTEKPHFSEIKKPVIRVEKVQNIILANAKKTISSSEENKEMNPVSGNFIEPITTEFKEEVAHIKSEKPEYSIEMEVDDLLAQAQKEIILNQSYNQNLVNAQDLLQDVEADIDRSFRNEVFEMIKTGFSNIKVAMAEEK